MEDHRREVFQPSEVRRPQGVVLQQHAEQRHHERPQPDTPHPQTKRPKQYVPLNRRSELSKHSRTCE